MADNELQKYPVEDGLKQICEYIAIGKDASLENQLIKKSLQENVVKFTPNDNMKRFGDTEMLNKWRSKGRKLFWLIGPEHDLAGIIWYGESEFPFDLNLEETPKETFAIRIYDGYTGKGLSKPFMRQSLRIYVEEKLKNGEELPVIWLQTDIDNIPALKSYTKFGYEEVCRDEKRVTMILPSNTLNSIISTT